MVENGKSKIQVRKDYNVSLSAVSKWVKLYSEIRVDENTVFTAKQIKEPQKRNAALEEENIILKKSDCHIHATREERSNAVHALRFQHKIITLCRVPGVNRSTYYKHFSNKVSNRTVINQKIRKCILSIYTASKKRLGAGKICYLLYVEYGIKISVRITFCRKRLYNIHFIRQTPKSL